MLTNPYVRNRQTRTQTTRYANCSNIDLLSAVFMNTLINQQPVNPCINNKSFCHKKQFNLLCRSIKTRALICRPVPSHMLLAVRLPKSQAGRQNCDRLEASSSLRLKNGRHVTFCRRSDTDETVRSASNVLRLLLAQTSVSETEITINSLPKHFQFDGHK